MKDCIYFEGEESKLSFGNKAKGKRTRDLKRLRGFEVFITECRKQVN